MQTISRAMKRISSLRAKPPKLALSASVASIPHRKLVDKEISPGYNLKQYYSARPGEIFANHYQLLVKIGWEAGPTVWFARDVARHVLTFIIVCGHNCHH